MLWYVTVIRLDGDYAVMKRNDDPSGETFLVARALLPDEIESGTVLKCENFMYEIV